MTEPTDEAQYLNIADQCTATATSDLATSILVDGENGTLRQLLNDAAYALKTQVREIERMRQDAERYQWLKSQSKEQLLNPRGAASEFCADMRTHWKLPVLMCSGPIGGYLSFDDAVDMLREVLEGKR